MAGAEQISWVLSAEDNASAVFNGATRSLDTLAGSTDNVNKKALLLGGVMVGAGAAIAKGLSSAVSAAMDFEREMANVWTVANVSKDELNEMGDAVLELSTNVPVSANTLAEGLYEVLSATIPVNESMQFLEVSAKAAAAGMTDTFTSVDALTTVINAYGMSASDVTKVSDIMFQTVLYGKATYEQLAQSIGTVATVAAVAGVPFEEVSAAVATMTRVGIDAATSTTYLRQVIMSVISPSQEAKDAANALGIEFTATHLKSVGLAQFLREVASAASGTVPSLDEAEVAALGLEGAIDKSTEAAGLNSSVLSTLFGNVRAYTGAAIIAGGSAQGFEQDLVNMYSAAGVSAGAFAKVEETTAAQMELLKNRVYALKVGIGQELLPVVNSIIERFIKWFDDFRARGGDVEAIIAKVGVMTSAILTLVGTGKLLDAFGLNFSKLFTLVKGFGPWGWGLVAIGAAVATNWDTLGGTFERIAEILQGAMKTVASVIASVLDPIADLIAWLDRIGLLTPIVVGFVGAFIGAKVILPIVNGIVGGIQTLITKIAAMGVIERMFAGIGNASINMGRSVTTATSAAGSALGGVGKAAQGAGQAAGAAAGATSAAAGALGALGGVASVGIPLLVGVGTAIWGYFDAQKRAHEEAVKLVSALGEQGTKANELLPAISNLRTEMENVAAAGGDVTQMQTDLNAKLAELAGILPATIENYNALTGAYTLNEEQAQQMANVLGVTGETQNSLAKAMAEGTSVLQEYDKGVTNIATATGTYQNSLNEMQTALADVPGGYAMVVNAGAAYAKNQEEGKKVMQDYINQLVNMRDTELATASAAGATGAEYKAIQDRWNGVINTMDTSRDAINDLSKNYGLSAADIVAQNTLMTQGIQQALGTMVQAGKDAGTKMMAIPADILFAFSSANPEYVPVGTEAMTNYMTAVLTQFNSDAPTVNTAVASMIQSLSNEDLSTKEGQLTAAALVAGNLQGWGADSGKIIETIQTMFPQISALEAEAIAAGKPVGSGLTDGVEAGMNPWKIISKAAQMIRDAKAAAEAEAEAESPSRLFAEVGRNLSAGVAVGIVEGSPLVERAMRSLIKPELNLKTVLAGRGTITVKEPVTRRGEAAGAEQNVSIGVINMEGINDPQTFLQQLQLEIARR